MLLQKNFSNFNKSLCFIVPNSWINNKSSIYLKNKIILPKLKELIDFKDKLIFKDARTYTTIINLSNNNDKKYYYKENLNEINIIKFKIEPVTNCDQLNNKLKLFYSGIATLADKLFIVDKIDNKFIANYNNKKYEIEENILAYYFKVTKFNSNNEYKYIIYPYDKNKKIINENYLSKNFPKTYNYLLEIKDILLSRDKGKTEKYEAWYAYGRK